MKKFGLRALAGGLAVMMVASVFAPVNVASAADNLLIAPNPNASKTLYITEDMVDEDGEIVISGGTYDRVVIAKEVDAKDIYFDQVTVGEMVVESGGESRVQLWEVDAEKVTVQEPELESLSFADLRDLLQDDETRGIALEMYKESRAKDAKAKKAAPTLVTKEDAKVETMAARGNVTLDLAEGEVGIVALEASEKIDRAKVTLKNYNGDVSFKGSEGKSNMTLNNVDSRIKTLKVEESTANNYFAVNAKNSVVLKAEVGGNARLALNALTGSLEVTEDATAANITLLNTVEELNIAGDNAKVDVAPCGRVELAAISGDKAKIGGEGILASAEITGSGAYVTTFGTQVEGVNTYVPPVYVEPVEDVSYDFSSLYAQGWNNTKLYGGSDGECYELNPGWGGEVFYVLPEAIDAAKYEEVTIKVKVDSDSPDALRVKLTAEGADKDDWGNPVPFFMKEVPSGSGEVEVTLPLDIYAGLMIDQVRFQSTEKGTVATFYSVFFKVRENGPVAPIVPPSDGIQCSPSQWEVVLYTDVDFRTYAGTTVKINAEATRRGGTVGPKAQRQFNDSSWTEIEKNSYIEIGTEWTDFGAESFVVPESWANEPKPVYYGIRTVTGEDYSRSLLYHKGFSVEVLEGEVPTPTPTPKPETPTAPSTLPDNYAEFAFKDLKVENKWNATTSEAEYHDGVKLDYEDQYKGVVFALPDKIEISEYGKMIITLSSAEKGLQIIVADKDGKELGAWYGRSSVPTKDFEIELTKDEYWEGSRDIPQDGNIKYITIQSNDKGETSAVVYRVAFVPRENENTPDNGDDNQGGSGDSGDTPSVPETPSAPEDGTPCTPVEGFAVHVFDTVDLRTFAGKTVTITVSVCKRGDAEAAVHLQTGGPYYAGVAGNDSWAKPVTGSWITYTCDFFVPEDWEACKDAVNFGLLMCKEDNGNGPLMYDYDACDFYYKDFSIVEQKAEEVKEFYFVKDGDLMKDMPFSVTAGEDGAVVLLEGFSLDSEWHWSQKMPQEMQSVIAPGNFATMAGVLENIKAIEYSVNLTNATPASTAEYGEYWAPQLIAVLQGNGDNGTWVNSSYCDTYVNGGKATEEAPKSMKTTFYLDSKTFDEIGETAAWTDAAIGQLGMKFQNAEPGSKIEGTYSIKVILK